MSDQRVWVVTSGEHSAYRVRSVWALREEAEAYANRLKDANDVEEYPVRSGLPRPVAYYDMTGRWPEDDFFRDLREQGPVEHQGWDDDGTIARMVVPVASEIGVCPGVTGGRSLWANSYIDLRAWGTDPERVRKVFSEKWAQIKADFDVLVEAGRQERAKRSRWLEALLAVRKAATAEAGYPVRYTTVWQAFLDAGEDPQKTMDIVRAAGFPPERTEAVQR